MNQSISSNADIIGASIEKQKDGSTCVSVTAANALKTANKYINDVITVEKDEEETITLERNEFLSVRFNAPGVAANDVTLKFNSKRLQISELKTIKTNLNENCEGRFSWHATAHGQTLSGEVSLEGGDNEEIELDFISPATMKSIANLASSWRTGSVMTSFGVGSSYVLSSDFALVAKVQKNFFLDEGVSTYLGASVRF